MKHYGTVTKINGTTRAYAAQRELVKRKGVIAPHSSRDVLNSEAVL